MLARDDQSAPKPTPLHALHVARGGRMVPFAGYDMPVQYAAGVLREHLHTRSAAGLFDVSHMGQIALHAKSGRPEDAALALERLVPQDIAGIAPGRQRYAQFTDQAGGILDDLMVANSRKPSVPGGQCRLQASRRGASARRAFGELRDRAAFRSRADRAAGTEGRGGAGNGLAPRSPRCVSWIAARGGWPASTAWCRARATPARTVLRSRLPADRAEDLAQALLEDSELLPIGLGARDSLRLEAGLCLYGHDIDTTTTPVEAALQWSIQNSRRPGGARAGGFPGAEVILPQLEQGPPRRRVGLKPQGRAPVREGAPLFADEASPQPIGKVTSGGFGPSINAPVAMGYLPVLHAGTGSLVFAELRGQRLPLQVTPLPFIAHAYHR